MGYDLKPSQSAGIYTVVFVPAVTRCPGGCAGSDSAALNSSSSSAFCAGRWALFWGWAALVRATLDLGSSPVQALLMYTCRERAGGWRFIPIVALLPLAPAAPQVPGTWRKGQWVLGAASPRCCAGYCVHCLPLSATARTGGSSFSAGHDRAGWGTSQILC